MPIACQLSLIAEGPMTAGSSKTTTTGMTSSQKATSSSGSSMTSSQKTTSSSGSTTSQQSVPAMMLVVDESATKSGGFITVPSSSVVSPFSVASAIVIENSTVADHDVSSAKKFHHALKKCRKWLKKKIILDEKTNIRHNCPMKWALHRQHSLKKELKF